MGLSVVPTEHAGIFSVSDGHDEALLDMTDSESLHDSVRTIEATFRIDVELDSVGTPNLKDRKFHPMARAERVANQPSADGGAGSTG